MSLSRHLARSLCLGAALCASHAVAAEPSIGLGRDRLLKSFDFEEADEQNFEDMPKNWYVIGRGDQTADPNFARKPLHQAMVQREGFPRHSVVKFNLPQEQRGDHNLHLSTASGSAGAFLEVGALAAVPGSDYLITARVRTDKLRYGRARLVAYFVDAEGRRIDESAVATDLLSTRNQWQNVSLRLAGDYPKAAWIGMQAELLQWQHQMPIRAAEGDDVLAATLPAGKHTVKYQDVEGDAWFDDIAVWQPPRVVVRTQSSVNLITGPTKPVLNLQVRDLSGQRLTAVLSVYDHRGQRIAEVARHVGGGEASHWMWEPPLPRYGWYMADLIVRDTAAAPDAPPVARTLRSLLWMPPRAQGNTHQFRQFTIDAHTASLQQMKLLPQITTATGLSSVLISAFDRDGSVATLDTRLAGLDGVLNAIWKQHGSVTLTLSPLPSEFTDRLDMDPLSPVWLLARERKDWTPLIAPLMLRQGQNVRRWQLGYSVNDAGPSADLNAALASTAAAIRELSPAPRIVAPWPLESPRRAELDKLDLDYQLVAPASIQPAQLPAYLQEWKRPPAKGVAVTLRTPPATELAHSGRIDDLALRLLHVWEAGVDGVTLQEPWATASDPLGAVHPDPLLGVFATAAQQLAGRRAVGRLQLGPHQRAIIFDGERGPMLAAWSDGGSGTETMIDFGGSPHTTDVWGNRDDLTTRDGKHVLPLTSTPVFVEGIDAQLALLRASFALTPRLVEASQQMHEHKLTIRNPWNQTLHGELTITDPGRNWRIEPRRINVSIDPGQTMTYPIQIGFPVAETAGAKNLVAKLQFASGPRPSVDLIAPFEIGLPGIELETGLSVTRRAGGGSTVHVTALVTNQNDASRTLQLFGLAAGQSRQERIITVKPGQTVIRRFQFESASGDITAAPIRIGLRDSSGPAVMNHLLKFD